jgi:uncharacterized protein YkwD
MVTSTSGQRSWAVVTVACVALVVAAPGTQAVAPKARVGSGWVRMGTPAGIRPDAELFGVSAATRTRAWAVGTENGVPLVLELRGQQWTKPAVPQVTWSGELRRVAAVNAQDVWASGTDQTSTARLLHSDGKTWTNVPLPGSDPGLIIDTMVSSPGHRPWILGRSGNGAKVLFHRTATRWVPVELPAGSFSAVTLNLDRRGGLLVAGTAATVDDTATLRVYRYAFGALRLVPTADPAPAVQLRNVIAAPDGIWLGGAYPDGSSAIVHWDGKAWHEADLGPSTVGSAGLRADAEGRPEWAIGTTEVGENLVAGYLKHVGNHWVRVPNAPGTGTPTINALTAVPGTRTSLAVGAVSVGADGQVVPLIERESAR